MEGRISVMHVGLREKCVSRTRTHRLEFEKLFEQSCALFVACLLPEVSASLEF